MAWTLTLGPQGEKWKVDPESVDKIRGELADYVHEGGFVHVKLANGTVLHVNPLQVQWWTLNDLQRPPARVY